MITSAGVSPGNAPVLDSYTMITSVGVVYSRRFMFALTDPYHECNLTFVN